MAALPVLALLLVLVAVATGGEGTARAESIPNERKREKHGVHRYLSPEIMESARKWAAERNVPLSWVVGTILLESAGDPSVEGDDPDENGEKRSVGLMQINTVAFRPQMEKAGLTRKMLFNPDTNISFGTQIMAGAKKSVLKSLNGHSPPNSASLGVLVRFMYWGPKLVAKYLSKDRDPRPLNPTLATRWEKMQSVIESRQLLA